MNSKTTIALAAVTGLLGAGTAAAVLPSGSEAEGVRTVTVTRTAETVHHHRGRHHRRHHHHHVTVTAPATAVAPVVRDDDGPGHDAGDDHGGHSGHGGHGSDG